METPNITDKKITLTEALAIIATLPKSKAVEDWAASAERWTNKPEAPTDFLKVSITHTASFGNISLLLELWAPDRFHLSPAHIFLALRVPKSTGRRTSLKQTHFVNGKKVASAMWNLKHNIETNIRFAAKP